MNSLDTIKISKACKQFLTGDYQEEMHSLHKHGTPER